MGIVIRYLCLSMRKFYRAGAISAETAVSPESIHVKRNLFFRRLLQFGWVVSVDGERYYLVEDEIKKRPLAWLGITRFLYFIRS